jgi:hypothetical protein
MLVRTTVCCGVVALILAAPAIAAASVQLGFTNGSEPIVCSGTTAPCVRTSLARDRMVVDSDAAGVVRIDRRYRAPGTRTFHTAASTNVALRSARSTNFAISSSALVGARPGTTCLRVFRSATEASAWKCIRYRPAISIGWAGDITLGSSYGNAPGDGRSVFADVQRFLRGPDLMIGNYEGTLSRGGTSRCSGGALCYIFQASPKYAKGLRWAGFDVMSVANNHALDKGANARRQTVAAIRAQHMGVTGLPNQVEIRQVADTKVGVVGFGFTEGTMLIRDLANVRRMVRFAARVADVVVVVAHPGEEGSAFQHVPYGDEGGRGNTRQFMHTAIAAGADVVFASGPHVVRGIEQIAGRLAFYSTGNFSGWKNFARGGASSNSGIVDVRLDHDGTFAGDANFHGVRLVGPGTPTLAGGGSVVSLVRSLSRSDFGSHSPHIARDGSITLR